MYSLFLGDKADNGMGLSYRPAGLCVLTGRYGIPKPELTTLPQSGTKNLATVMLNEDLLDMTCRYSRFTVL